MMKYILPKIICYIVFIGVLIVGMLNLGDIPKANAYGFNAGYIIDNSKFIDVNSMSVADIQNFLNSKGGVLKDYSENGRSAAQIIYDAAHGHGDASGSANGIDIHDTVSPKVILATLQKEQSLITRTDRSDYAFDWAMGYGCPESGPHIDTYKGFTKQVEWAAWQFRYNYERADGHGFSGYQVGQTMNFDNEDVRLENRATSSLYRYTPHIQYSFSNLYLNYFGSPVGNIQSYQAEIVSKSPNLTLDRNGSTTVEVKFLNAGLETWYREGSNPLRLGLDKYWASKTAWQGSGWVNENRMSNMIEESVTPGQTATFRFEIHCPDTMPPGTHRFYARLLAENLTWFDNPSDNGYVYWDIQVNKPYAQWVDQSSNQIYALPGENKDLWVKFKNTDSNNWITPLRLATDKLNNENASKQFKDSSWVNDYRMTETNQVIGPGQEYTFNFKIKVPDNLAAGRYRFNTRLVSENYSWFDSVDINGGAWWEIIISEPQAKWMEQSQYPTLQKNDSTTLWVKFKNTSNVTWSSTGLHPVRLGLDRLWTASTQMQGLGWVNENRMGSAIEGDIAPGETGTYRFNVYIPPTFSSGQYRFYARLVSEYFSWFEPDVNGGAWWEITVQ